MLVQEKKKTNKQIDEKRMRVENMSMKLGKFTLKKFKFINLKKMNQRKV